jgi:hypothetical protein
VDKEGNWLTIKKYRILITKKLYIAIIAREMQRLSKITYIFATISSHPSMLFDACYCTFQLRVYNSSSIYFEVVVEAAVNRKTRHMY